MGILQSLLTSSARAKVLTLLLMNSASRYYQRQIQSLTGLPPRAVQREMELLESLGLVVKEIVGNRAYYTVNRSFALYPELKGLVLKTSGLGDALREQMNRESGIQVAFIYGSYAADQERADSDIDLLLVGAVDAVELHSLVRAAQDTLGREINYSLLTSSEFRERTRSGDSFLRNVLDGPKVFLKGDHDTLRSIAE